VQAGTPRIVADRDDQGVVLDSRDRGEWAENRFSQPLLPVERRVVVHVSDDLDVLACGALRLKDVADDLAMASGADDQDLNRCFTPLNSWDVACPG